MPPQNSFCVYLGVEGRRYISPRVVLPSVAQQQPVHQDGPWLPGEGEGLGHKEWYLESTYYDVKPQKFIFSMNHYCAGSRMLSGKGGKNIFV